MVSSFTSAVALIGLHHVREIDPRAVVAHFSGVALACCIAALLIFPTHYALTLDWQTLLLLLGVGVSATVGQMLLTLAFGLGSPARGRWLACRRSALPCCWRLRSRTARSIP